MDPFTETGDEISQRPVPGGLDEVVELSELAVGDPGGRELSSVAVERLTNQKQVVQTLAGMPVNSEPATLLLHDVSLELQPEQRLADGRSAHAEHLREVGFDDERPRDEPATHDGGTKFLIGPVGQRGPAHVGSFPSAWTRVA